MIRRCQVCRQKSLPDRRVGRRGPQSRPAKLAPVAFVRLDRAMRLVTRLLTETSRRADGRTRLFPDRPTWRASLPSCAIPKSRPPPQLPNHDRCVASGPYGRTSSQPCSSEFRYIRSVRLMPRNVSVLMPSMTIGLASYNEGAGIVATLASLERPQRFGCCQLTNPAQRQFRHDGDSQRCACLGRPDGCASLDQS